MSSISTRAHKRALTQREHRRAAFDKLKPEEQRGLVRPGSLNPAKGGGTTNDKPGRRR